MPYTILKLTFIILVCVILKLYVFVTSIYGDPHRIVRSVTLILTLNYHKSTEFNRGNVKFTNYKKVHLKHGNEAHLKRSVMLFLPVFRVSGRKQHLPA